MSQPTEMNSEAAVYEGKRRSRVNETAAVSLCPFPFPTEGPGTPSPVFRDHKDPAAFSASEGLTVSVCSVAPTGLLISALSLTSAFLTTF
mmetsp:Transcript_26045/g.51099  ORF Transcript_26045/g.51099 Transcript_26045/m.51099 type:complete len:90 (+) Transcript_26045:451-720(+)